MNLLCLLLLTLELIVVCLGRLFVLICFVLVSFCWFSYLIVCVGYFLFCGLLVWFCVMIVLFVVTVWLGLYRWMLVVFDLWLIVCFACCFCLGLFFILFGIRVVWLDAGMLMFVFILPLVLICWLIVVVFRCLVIDWLGVLLSCCVGYS